MQNSISIHGPTSEGGFNVIGMDDTGFFLQGHLTIEQLKELRAEITRALKAQR